MFLLGILSLFQIILLPGLLLLKLFKVKTQSNIQTFLYSFGLSLSFNYFLICILVFLKIYLPVTIFILFLLEILLLTYLIVKEKIRINFDKSIKDYYFSFLDYLKNLSSIHRFLLLFSCLLLLFFISLIYTNADTVFYFTDAIARKPWIKTWSSNHSFSFGHYLQFLPVNLSLTYIFIHNTSIDFFSKGFMPLFFIGILLIFFDLSFKKKPIVHLTGFIIYGFILLIFYGILFISDFTYDIPVSFFGFLAFYVTQKEDKPGFHIKTVLLVIIFAISAANIKLAGIFVVGLSFLWILYYIYINKKNISKKKLLRVIGYITLILASGFSWYIFMPAQMAEGVGSSPFKPYNGLYESFMYGIKMLFYSFGSLFSIFILITLISALLTKTKHIVLLVIAPLFIVWAFWYSYDCRNLSVAIPFVAYSSAYGLEFIYGIIRKRFNYLNLSLINNSNTFLLDLMDNNWKLSILFILLLFIFFVVVRTNIFFNFVINLAYFFWRFYFQYNKSVFVIELGYYKDVIYFVDTIKVLILLILALFILRKSRIKIKHLIIFILISLTCLNFTLLKKENILKRQNYDKEMVHLHNVYFKIHPYINNSEFEKSIITNSSLFSELIFPRGIKVEYVPNIKQEIINNLKNKNVKNILLEKNKLRKGEIDKIYKVLDKNYNVYFNNDGFIFFTKS